MGSPSPGGWALWDIDLAPWTALSAGGCAARVARASRYIKRGRCECFGRPWAAGVGVKALRQANSLPAGARLALRQRLALSCHVAGRGATAAGANVSRAVLRVLLGLRSARVLGLLRGARGSGPEGDSGGLVKGSHHSKVTVNRRRTPRLSQPKGWGYRLTGGLGRHTGGLMPTRVDSSIGSTSQRPTSYRETGPETATAPAGATQSVSDRIINTTAAKIAFGGCVTAASMSLGATLVPKIGCNPHPSGVSGAAIEGLIGGLAYRALREAQVQPSTTRVCQLRGSDAWKEFIMPSVGIFYMLTACAVGAFVLYGAGLRDDLFPDGYFRAAAVGSGVVLVAVAVGVSIALGPKKALLP